MAKITLNNIDNESVPSASSTINANNDTVETAFENTLSRDGTSPNQMEANLDLNSYRILNHAPARGSSFNNDLIRVGDLADLVAELGVQGPPGPAGDGSGDMLRSLNLSDVQNPVVARANLGLTIGANVQGYDINLQNISDISWLSSSMFWKNTSGVVENMPISADMRSFLGAATDAVARSALGLGTAAERNVGTISNTVAAGDDSRFRRLNIVVKNSSSDFVGGEPGSLVRHSDPGAHTFTLQPVATSSIAAGSVIQVRNAINAGAVTLARGAGVSLYIAGDLTSSDLTLAPGGFCTLVHEANDFWVASGAGLS